LAFCASISISMVSFSVVSEIAIVPGKRVQDADLDGFGLSKGDRGQRKRGDPRRIKKCASVSFMMCPLHG
jgi:hypothetical protein